MNIASRVQNSAGGDEIYLTEGIYNDPAVLEQLQKNGCATEPVLLQLKGIDEQMKIYKVALSN